jgi:Kef-type K+ transport system membrane component KefB
MRKPFAKTAITLLKVAGGTVLAFAVLKGTAVLLLSLLFGFKDAVSDDGYVLISDVMGWIGAASVLVVFLARTLVDAIDRLVDATESRRP